MLADAPNLVPPGGTQPHIVIAYSYADNEFARKLAGALRRDGISRGAGAIEVQLAIRVDFQGQPRRGPIASRRAAVTPRAWTRSRPRTRRGS